jgi:hypothetical protein
MSEYTCKTTIPIKVLFINYMLFNPLLLLGCKDGWMSDVWAARPWQAKRPTSTHQETLFTSVNLSLLHFTQDVKVQMNPFCAANFVL